MNINEAKGNIRKVYNDIQMESTYGSMAKVNKMHRWAKILGNALALLGD